MTLVAQALLHSLVLKIRTLGFLPGSYSSLTSSTKWVFHLVKESLKTKKNTRPILPTVCSSSLLVCSTASLGPGTSVLFVPRWYRWSRWPQGQALATNHRRVNHRISFWSREDPPRRAPAIELRRVEPRPRVEAGRSPPKRTFAGALQQQDPESGRSTGNKSSGSSQLGHCPWVHPPS